MRTIVVRAIFSILLALVLVFLWMNFAIHDWQLWKFRQSFATIRHPQDTARVKAYSRLGLLIANGNHIDLFAGEARTYTGSRQQIMQWYAGKTIPSQLAAGQRSPVEVVFVDSGQLSRDAIGVDRPDLLNDIVRDVTPSSSHVYIVYSLDAVGYDPGIDIRGY